MALSPRLFTICSNFSLPWVSSTKYSSSKYFIKYTSSDDNYKCRTCKSEHCNLSCQFNNLQMAQITTEAVKSADVKNGAGTSNKTKPQEHSIRISNLSTLTTQANLGDLVKPFGPVKKRYLAMEKGTGHCKGFAFVRFKFRADAAKAIQALHGRIFHDFMLNVEWSKPKDK